MNQFLEDFRQRIETGKTRLLAISEEQASEARPDKWSPKQILGHLIDSAANNHERFVRAQFTNDLVCRGYDQDAWVTVQQYQNEPWADLIELWAAYNRHLLHLIGVMPKNLLNSDRKEHNLDQVAFRPVSRSSSTTLEYFVRDYADHLSHHLTQIFGPDTATNN